jgi:hypothetical protein
VVDVPDLYLLPDFITEKEERDLISSIDKHEWTSLQHRVERVGRFVVCSRGVCRE